MMKPIFSSGSAIQRAKPLFELSDVGVEIERKRVKKPSTKTVPPAPVERDVPFNSEMILEAVDCSLGNRLGTSESLVGLTKLTLELADLQDLFTESTTSTDGEQISERRSRHNSDDTLHASVDSIPSLTPSRKSILLAPLKIPPQISRVSQQSKSCDERSYSFFH